MPRRYLTLLVLVLAALACSWSDFIPPAAPVIEPSPIPTFAIPTLTATPTETPLPTPTSTPDAPIAWPKDPGANCRYGPGTEWESISSLTPGTITEIEGRTINTAWWYVRDPLHSGEFCWVSYDVVETAGNLNIVPIAEPPVASVTAASVDAVVSFTACGGDNQVTFNGSIAANGPTEASYHWEVGGDQQRVLPDETITFTKAETQKITANVFSADCGSYSVKLIVSSPNEEIAEKAFTIQAP